MPPGPTRAPLELDWLRDDPGDVRITVEHPHEVVFKPRLKQEMGTDSSGVSAHRDVLRGSARGGPSNRVKGGQIRGALRPVPDRRRATDLEAPDHLGP